MYHVSRTKKAYKKMKGDSIMEEQEYEDFRELRERIESERNYVMAMQMFRDQMIQDELEFSM